MFEQLLMTLEPTGLSGLPHSLIALMTELIVWGLPLDQPFALKPPLLPLSGAH